jgi:hypothetical protein
MGKVRKSNLSNHSFYRDLKETNSPEKVQRSKEGQGPQKENEEASWKNDEGWTY